MLVHVVEDVWKWVNLAVLAAARSDLDSCRHELMLLSPSKPLSPTAGRLRVAAHGNTCNPCDARPSPPHLLV